MATTATPEVPTTTETPASNWVTVEATGTMPDGSKQAKINGQWVPVSSTGTMPDGSKRALVGAATAPTPAAAAEPVEAPTPQAQVGTTAQIPGALGPIRNADGSVDAPAPAQHTSGEAQANMIGSSVIGGALAAATPEVLKGAGAVMDKLPGRLGSLGKALTALGIAAVPTRTAVAGWGAISGGVGAGAGEAVRVGGGSEGQITAAEIGGGLAAPAVAAAVGTLPTLTRGSWALVRGLLSKTADVAANPKEAHKAIMASMQGVPEHDLYRFLKEGAEAGVQVARDAGEKLIEAGYAQAAKLVSGNPAAAEAAVAEAKREAQKLTAAAAQDMSRIGKIASGRLESAEVVGRTANAAREKIGARLSYDQIGAPLQGKAVQVRDAADAKLKATDAELRAATDAVVDAQERAGKFLDAEPAMKALKAELEQKLLSTVKGREASTVPLPGGELQGIARVTEGGVEGAYGKVLDAIKNKRVQTGVDADGIPRYQTFKTSFEALGHVRRKLGDAAFGQEKEGYGALGQKIAKDLYKKVSQIQEDYAGKAFTDMQENYSQRMTAAEKWKTAAGRRLVDTDPAAADVLKTDPASIPGRYFQSAQGVKDLITLTESPSLVHQSAHNFAARATKGMSAANTEKWIAENDGWIPEVPGLGQKLAAAVKEIAKIERVQGKLEASAANLQSKRLGIRDATQAELGEIAVQGRKEASARIGSRVEEAAGIRTRAEEAAALGLKEPQAWKDLVTGKGFDVEAVSGLLRHGTASELQRGFRYTAGVPGGPEAIEGSVRRVLGQTSALKLPEVWNGRLMVALKEGKVLPPERLAKLDADVQRAMAEAGEKGPTLVRNLVAAAVAGVPQAVMRREANVPEQQDLPWKQKRPAVAK